MEANRQRPDIWIQTFGDFGIFYRGARISTALERAKKLTDLAEYLIMHHERAVPKTELYELLWPDEDCANPRNALKTLIHRFRSLLIQGGAPEGAEFLVVRQGTCQWSPNISYGIDAEEFDRIYQHCCSPDGRPQIDLLHRAATLYRGRFLNETEMWTVTSSTYYHSCFLRMAHLLCRMLREEGRSEELIEWCRPMLRMDDLDETLNRELLLALIACGRVQEADNHYNYITEAYYSRLGIQIPERLRELYRSIANAEQSMELDIATVCDKLSEKDNSEGAFVCEYSIFRDLYRIEERCLERYGGRVFLGLITVTDAYLHVPDTDTLGRVMEQVLDVVRRALRRGDIVARYSPAQYVVLLPTVTFETGEKVLERIRRAYRKRYPKSPMVLSCKLRPLHPPDSKSWLAIAPNPDEPDETTE